MRSQILVLVATCAIAIGVASCKKSSTPAGPSGGGGGSTTASVTIPKGDGYSASAFTPGSLTIAPGTTVTWGNQDTQAHTVTSDANTWTGDLLPGGTSSHKFDVRGSFGYKCTVHAGMTGTIIVQ